MNKKRILALVLAITMALSVLTSVVFTTVAVSAAEATADDTIDVQLYRGNAEELKPFVVSNMYPGDTENETFVVEVYHNKPVTLHLELEHTSSTKGLENLLHLRVVNQHTGKLLLDEPFATAHGQIFQRVLPAPSSGNKTEQEYLVEAYLPTSAGNEVQNAKLTANFHWYVSSDSTGSGTSSGDTSSQGTPGGSETDGLVEPPKTGDTTPYMLWVALGVGSVIVAMCLVVLLLRRNKREGDDR